MSEKKGLGGLFVNKKSSASTASSAGGAKPKNVKQRWMIVGGASIGFIVLASSFFSSRNAPVQTAPKQETDMIKVAPQVESRAWQSVASRQLQDLETRNQKYEAQLTSLTQQLSAMKEKEKADKEKPADKPLPGTVVPPPTMGGDTSKGQPTAPPPPPTFPTATPNAPANTGTNTQAVPPMIPTGTAQPAADPQVFKPENKPATASATGVENVKSTVKYKKNPYSGYLPAGSFAPVVMLNGLDAGTSSATQANPMPVLLTITDQATLPGSAKYSIKSCFVLGTGYGDLSAERVYVRISRLSCVDKSDRLVLSADVQAYLVDSDGKIGLRGKVVDRQGAKLGKALLAGFAQGLAGAMGSAQSVVTTTAQGTTSALGGDAALRASGLSGAQSAAQQLAQFYLKEAQAIFPVISVDTGRTGTIVFTDNTSLTWATGDTQFVKDIKPD
jgi:conjugal transfer pilus assembly protein TraB